MNETTNKTQPAPAKTSQHFCAECGRLHFTASEALCLSCRDLAALKASFQRKPAAKVAK